MLEPYELAFMVAGSDSMFGIKPFDPNLTKFVSSWNFTLNGKLAFIDAGSRGARSGAGEAGVVKLAVLELDSGSASWNIMHPIPSSGYPLAVFEGGDNIRRGLTYLIEVAALLAQSRRGVRFIVRHGPLQQVHYYLRPGYDIDSRRLRAALSYAGLDASDVQYVLDSSEICGSFGSHGIHNLGLALLAIIRKLVDEVDAGKIFVAGVVEDVSRSKAFLGSIVAEIVAEAWRKAQGGQNAPIPLNYDVAKELFDAANDYYRDLLKKYAQLTQQYSIRDFNSRCFCIDSNRALINTTNNFEQFISDILVETRRYTQYKPGQVPLDVLALVVSGVLPNYGDAILIPWLYYIDASKGARFTTLRGRLAAYRAALEELNNRAKELVSCRGNNPDSLVEPLKRVYFTYMVPEPPPSCLELQQRSGNLTSPCELAKVQRIPVPVRVEILLPKHTTSITSGYQELLAFLYWSAYLTAYKYPAPLLLVDRFSRVSISELGVAKLAAELISARRVPYSMLLHHWETRVEI